MLFLAPIARVTISSRFQFTVPFRVCSLDERLGIAKILKPVLKPASVVGWMCSAKKFSRLKSLDTFLVRIISEMQTQERDHALHSCRL